MTQDGNYGQAAIAVVLKAVVQRTTNNRPGQKHRKFKGFIVLKEA